MRTLFVILMSLLATSVHAANSTETAKLEPGKSLIFCQKSSTADLALESLNSIIADEPPLTVKTMNNSFQTVIVRAEPPYSVSNVSISMTSESGILGGKHDVVHACVTLTKE